MMKSLFSSDSGLDSESKPISPDATVDNQNMKLVKFNLLCKEMRKYFLDSLPARYPIPIYLISHCRQEKNAYIKCIAYECFSNDNLTRMGWEWPRYSYYDGQFLYNLEELVDTIQDLKENKVLGYHLKLEDVFWNLFSLSIDEETYKTELSSVVDLAYCLGFTPEMIGDWCRAVEYVLEGNHLSEDCDLHCDTLEGARFFLHLSEEDFRKAAKNMLQQKNQNTESVLSLL